MGPTDAKASVCVCVKASQGRVLGEPEAGTSSLTPT